jgi:hypothetical protein
VEQEQKMKNKKFSRKSHLLSPMAPQTRTQHLQAEYDQCRQKLIALNGQANAFDQQTALMRRMNELCMEIQCEENPELRNRTCALCEGLYNGYGNNGWPLCQGKVCDECNASKVIPARWNEVSDDEEEDE